MSNPCSAIEEYLRSLYVSSVADNRGHLHDVCDLQQLLRGCNQLEVQSLIAEVNEIIAHDTIDKEGAWKKKLRSQSHELFEILPKTIQEQLLSERDPH
ncbi:hypothetical protein L2E82_31191 [Cichorium intybus]|uniref:Uncharacterized protein n=1 Tax=Cichorium intybus TaxID=13427 RepID=A0ACB9D2R1_CICIN|nr:hypothetical protein L2E82_31191 [Cichorium intybus]